jgi:hypothetical protein
VLVGDVCADIPIHIEGQVKADTWYWLFAFVCPFLMMMGVAIHVYGLQFLELVRTPNGIRKIIARPEFENTYEVYSFFLTVSSIVLYLVGTYATAGFRKGGEALHPGDPDHPNQVADMIKVKCPTWDTDLPTYLNTAVGIALRLDFMYRFVKAPEKLKHFLDGQNLLDFFSISDMPAWLLELDYYPTTNSFGCLKYLRILRAANMKQFKEAVGPVNHKLVAVILRMIGAFFLLSGIIFTVEFPLTPNLDSKGDPYMSYWELVCFHDALYYSVVTLTTVGFGDFSPKTTSGRLLSAVLLIVGIGIISISITELMNTLQMYSPYNNKYRGPKGQPLVIVCGKFSNTAISNFLQEFFHPNHQGEDTKFKFKKVIILGDSYPDEPMEELVAMYKGKVQFLTSRDEQNPIKMAEGLRRSGIASRSCEAVFVLSKPSAGGADSDADDAQCILWTMTIRKVCKLIRGEERPRVLVQVQHSANKLHVQMAGADLVVCASEFKYQMMAHSFCCYGASTLIANLIRSSDYEGSHYADGCDWEIYIVDHMGAFVGKKYFEVVKAIYNNTCKMPILGAAADESGEGGVLLFGLKCQNGQIICNPGKDYTIRAGDQGIVFAKDMEDAEQVGKKSELALGPLPGNNLENALFTAEESAKLGIGAKADGSEGGKISPSSRKQSMAGRAKTKRTSSHNLSARVSSNDSESSADFVNMVAMHEKQLDGRAKILTMDECTKESVRNELSGHLIVCGSFKSGLDSLMAHIDQYRLPKGSHEVVMLSPVKPTPMEWEKISHFHNLHFSLVIGSPFNVKDLLRAGAMSARMVMVMGHHGQAIKDEDAIRISLTMSHIRTQSNMYTMIELEDTVNMIFLDPTAWWPMNSDVGKDALAPIFAAGRIYSSTILDTLVCQAFFNSNMPKIMQNFISGPNALFHVPVPQKFHNRQYKELFEDFLTNHNFLVVAVYACAGSKASGEMLRNEIKEEEDIPKKKKKKHAENKDEEIESELLPVLVTNPSPDMVLSSPFASGAEPTKLYGADGRNGVGAPQHSISQHCCFRLYTQLATQLIAYSLSATLCAGLCTRFPTVL